MERIVDDDVEFGGARVGPGGICGSLLDVKGRKGRPRCPEHMCKYRGRNTASRHAG